MKRSFFPHHRISQVPIKQIQEKLANIFKQRNKPGSCRVDNGEPFATPSNDTPPLLALWLIGHDIDMIWNKPYTPQMNGVVEKMQDTSQRWAEVKSAKNYEELQQKLNEQARIQRQVYPVTRLNNQTRLQVYPNLEKSNRQWLETGFDVQRVYDFLARRIFNRKISKSGQITHYGQKISGLYAYRGKTVQVKLEPKTLCWIISCDYKHLKSIDASKTLDKDAILNLSTCQ